MSVLSLLVGGEELLLEHHAELFPDALELLEVLVVLALVLDLGVDACSCVSGRSSLRVGDLFSQRAGDIPSNILTAVGKSLTRLAALRAAMTTLGEGTRS